MAHIEHGDASSPPGEGSVHRQVTPDQAKGASEPANSSRAARGWEDASSPQLVAVDPAAWKSGRAGAQEVVLVAEVQLRPVVTPSDRAAVMTLRRGPGQARYLNSMAEIFAEAEDEQRAMPRP